MFDIHKVSDKYKILYLKEGVKNKFLTLLLIGLDNQYMNTDLETLNNSSNYYKKNLNQKIKSAFGENFNIKSNGHLDALSEMCGVNFIIKNLTSNENKYLSKIYGKTLYFVNKGNEYGLVLKSNKKSLKAELTDGTLSAFEKLNLEGGVGEGTLGPKKHIATGERKRQNKAIKAAKAEDKRVAAEAARRQQAPSSTLALQQPATPPRSGSPTFSETSTTSVPYTVFNPLQEKQSSQQRTNESLSSATAPPPTAELIRSGPKIRLYEKLQTVDRIPYTNSELLNAYNTLLNKISREFLLINNYKKKKIKIKKLYNSKMYSINTEQIVKNFKAKCLFLLYYIKNDIESSPLDETIESYLKDTEEFLGDNKLDEYEYSIESIIDDMQTINKEISVDEKLLNEIKTELLLDSLYINNIDTTHAFEDCYDYDRCIQDEPKNRMRNRENQIEENKIGSGGNAQDYNQNGGWFIELNQLDNNDADINNNGKISYLLENGIDSTHDFAGKDSQIQSDEPAKKEVFNLFWPEDISRDEKIRNVFNKFDKCVTEDMINKNEPFKYAYNDSGSFGFKVKPSISNAKKGSWPFSKGWERYATLYYTQGLNDKHFGHDIYKKCSSDNKKVLIISQDSQGGSTGLLNLLGNVLFLPETIKTSFDNHIKNNPKYKNVLIKQLEEITNYSLEKEGDDILKHLIVNSVTKYQANKLGVNFLSDMNRFYWTNPSQLIDAAGSSDKNIDDVKKELEYFSKYFSKNNDKNLYKIELTEQLNISSKPPSNQQNILKNIFNISSDYNNASDKENKNKVISDLINRLPSLSKDFINNLGEDDYKKLVDIIFILSFYDNKTNFKIRDVNNLETEEQKQYKYMSDIYIDDISIQSPITNNIIKVLIQGNSNNRIQFIKYHIYNIQQLLTIYNPTKFTKSNIKIVSQKSSPRFKIEKKNIKDYYNSLNTTVSMLIKGIIDSIENNNLYTEIKEELSKIKDFIENYSIIEGKQNDNDKRKEYDKYINKFRYNKFKYTDKNGIITKDNVKPIDVIEANVRANNSHSTFKKLTQYHFISIGKINGKSQHKYIVNRMYSNREISNLNGENQYIWNADPNTDWNYIFYQLDTIYNLLNYNNLKKQSSNSLIELKKQNLYNTLQGIGIPERSEIYKFNENRELKQKSIRKRLPDFQLFSRLYKLDYYVGNQTQVNLLKETYDVHFMQLSRYINIKLENEYIEFEFMMIQYFNSSPDRINPCLVIRRKKVIDAVPFCFDRIEIDYTKLGEIGTITKILNALESSSNINDNIKKLEKKSPKDKTEEKVFNDCIGELIRLNTFINNFSYKSSSDKDKSSSDKDKKDIFKRMLYTFKMLGDQGQVNFFRFLKEKGSDQFTDNFEVLLTTHDSLCRLYACTNEISNMTMTEHNFPSEYYCESNPRGMVYYGNVNKDDYNKDYLSS